MTPEFALAVIRFIHFAAVFLVLGTIVFQRKAAADDVAELLAVRLGRWEFWAAALALISCGLWLLPEVAIAGDGWPSLADGGIVSSLLTGTLFGQVWCVRTVMSVAMLLFAGLGWPAPLEACAVLLAFSLGWVGHGVMLGGAEGWALTAALGLHVTAAGLWVGALPAVAACLRLGSATATASSLRAFSRYGQWAVAIAVLAGLFVSYEIAGADVLGPATPYVRLLGVKVTMVAAMVCLAAVNGYGLLPGLSKGNSARALALLTLVETGLAAFVLALVAVFGNLSPMG